MDRPKRTLKAENIAVEHIDWTSDYNNLCKAVADTGIVELLIKHKKEYISLEPHWYDDTFKTINRTLETKYNVVFFLHPKNRLGQDKYTSGWFTVENLQAWAIDEGPVCKSET